MQPFIKSQAYLLENWVQQAERLCGSTQVGPCAVPQVGGGQRAQRAVRRQLAAQYKKQDRGDVMQTCGSIQGVQREGGLNPSQTAARPPQAGLLGCTLCVVVESVAMQGSRRETAC